MGPGNPPKFGVLHPVRGSKITHHATSIARGAVLTVPLTGYIAAMMDHLAGLNERQREAAMHGEGPLLIIAGAGAGKTKTITHRIARLISEGVPAWHILALTFTNKAAGEMRERVHLLLQQSGLQGGGTPLIATFHSLGVRLLREFHEEAGLPRAFSIWDRDDSLRAIKRAHDLLGLDKTPRSSLGAISNKKGSGISQQDFAAEASSFREQTIAQVWEL